MYKDDGISSEISVLGIWKKRDESSLAFINSWREILCCLSLFLSWMFLTLFECIWILSSLVSDFDLMWWIFYLLLKCHSEWVCLNAKKPVGICWKLFFLWYHFWPILLPAWPPLYSAVGATGWSACFHQGSSLFFCSISMILLTHFYFYFLRKPGCFHSRMAFRQ